MQELNYKNFRIGVILSLILGTMLIVISLLMGKIPFFLWLNTDLGIAADYFFGVYTDAGNSWMWVGILFILYFLKRQELIPLAVASFIFVTIFTQVCKYLIVPNEARPWKAIADHTLIHHVSWVETYLISSFPSGHSATAFTFYLIFCLIIPKKWWIVVGFIAAALVGYARIYLAEHFPLDVGGGILTAVLSVWLALPVQRWWEKRKIRKSHAG